jgi:hypothetical protein
MNLPYRNTHVYHRDRVAGLHWRLSYALTHEYARGWIAPLTLLRSGQEGHS